MEKVRFISKWSLRSLGIVFLVVMSYLVFQLWTLDLNTGLSKNQAGSELIKNKLIPSELKEEILEALTYFPELEKIKIEFRFKDEIDGAFMQAQPKVASLFNSAKFRTYVVNIKKHFQSKDSVILMSSLPKNVLVGWLGHELGHILDYHGKDFFSVTELGIGYVLSDDYVKSTEFRADFNAIQHGLKDKILATKNFILNHPKLPESYKRKIRDFYPSEESIRIMGIK